MAWFDPKKNRGHKGGTELGFGGTYGITTKVERYKSTEEYVGYGSYPGPGLHGYGPERKDSHARPWTSTSLDRTKKGDMLAHRDNTPPPRGKFHNNNNHNNYYSSEDEDDVVCNDEQCYPKPKGHVNHNVPYHETNSYPKNRPTYTVPVTTQPRKDPYYEPANGNRTVEHKVNPPPPVKTRPDHHTKMKGLDSPVSVEAPGSPFASSPGSPFTPSPRKEHGYGSREGVDSPGRFRRFKGESPRGGVVAEEIKYKGTIDSIEAARKYGGVFVDY